MRQSGTKPPVASSKETSGKQKQLPAARLERKRQINRLSAQRKRIREKHMMKILSDQYAELSVKRKMHEIESKKLKRFLEVVKAKINGKSESNLKDSEEMVDLLASGLIDLASYVQEDSKTEDQNSTHIKTPTGHIPTQECYQFKAQNNKGPPAERVCSPSEHGSVYTPQALLANFSNISANANVFQLVQELKAVEEAQKEASRKREQSRQVQLQGLEDNLLQHKKRQLRSETTFEDQKSSSFATTSALSSDSSFSSAAKGVVSSRSASQTKTVPGCTSSSIKDPVQFLSSLLMIQDGSKPTLSASAAPSKDDNQSELSKVGKASDDIRLPGPDSRSLWYQQRSPSISWMQNQQPQFCDSHSKQSYQMPAQAQQLNQQAYQLQQQNPIQQNHQTLAPQSQNQAPSRQEHPNLQQTDGGNQKQTTGDSSSQQQQINQLSYALSLLVAVSGLQQNAKNPTMFSSSSVPCNALSNGNMGFNPAPVAASITNYQQPGCQVEVQNQKEDNAGQIGKLDAQNSSQQMQLQFLSALMQLANGL